jgi:hypothetical protein
VSKHHAVLSYFENQGFLIRDLNSKHGTYINSRKADLDSGSLIRVVNVVNADNGAAAAGGGRLGCSVTTLLTSQQEPLFIGPGAIIRFGRVKCRIHRGCE